MLVEIERATFGYGNRSVVRADALRLYPGRCLGIFGPNGAGKTTLVRGLTGLLRPMSGRVTRQRVDFRFGYLPQQRSIDLHWPMTGFDAASMAVSAYGRFGWIRSDAERVKESLQKLHVDDLSNRRFAKLSGGQQQRLLLAGALAARPNVLVLDEPTDGLDVRSRKTLLDLLKSEQEGGLCTVLISHDIQDLLAIADDIALLSIADTPEEPNPVETIAPAELADRLVHRALRTDQAGLGASS